MVRGRPTELDNAGTAIVSVELDKWAEFKKSADAEGKSTSEIVRQLTNKFVELRRKNIQGSLDATIEEAGFKYMPSLGEVKKRQVIDKMEPKEVEEVLHESSKWVREAKARLRVLGYDEEVLEELMRKDMKALTDKLETSL